LIIAWLAQSAALWSRLAASPSALVLSAWFRDVWMRTAALASSLAILLVARSGELWSRTRREGKARARRRNRAALDRRQVLALRRRVPQAPLQTQFIYHVDSPHLDLVRQSFDLMCAASALTDDPGIQQQPALRLAEAALDAWQRDLKVEVEQRLVGLQTVVLALGAVGEPRGPGECGGLAGAHDAPA
jgi:hypothetical protein